MLLLFSMEEIHYNRVTEETLCWLHETFYGSLTRQVPMYPYKSCLVSKPLTNDTPVAYHRDDPLASKPEPQFAPHCCRRLRKADTVESNKSPTINVIKAFTRGLSWLLHTPVDKWCCFAIPLIMSGPPIFCSNFCCRPFQAMYVVLTRTP